MYDGAITCNWISQMMQIVFERTGGIMGRKVNLHLDLDEMPADQSIVLRRLIDESDFFDLVVSPKRTSPLDEFHYAITITTGTIQHTVRTSDSSMPQALRPLLNELLTHARNSR